MVMILSRITGTNSEVEPSRYATLGPPNTINHTLKLDHCVRDQIGGLHKALVARSKHVSLRVVLMGASLVQIICIF